MFERFGPLRIKINHCISFYRHFLAIVQYLLFCQQVTVALKQLYFDAQHCPLQSSTVRLIGRESSQFANLQ